MVTILKPVVAAAFALAALASGAVAETLSMHVVKPAHGLSLDAGQKKIAGYYLASASGCDLTLMIADLPDADGKVSGRLARMNVPVASGSRMQVFTADGHALEVACALNAKLMTVRPLNQTALEK